MLSKDSDRRSSDIMKIDQVVIEQKNQNGVSVRKYTKGKLLGKGGFAKCYQIFPHDNNKKYAVKLIQKSSLNRSKAKQKLQSEINIHKKLNSEHVVGFHHFFQDTSNVYIILQLCSNQTLSQLVKRRKRITQLQAKFYLYQIVMGIKDIHQQKVIHRDLKLGNLFLTQKLQIKIGDFGLAAKLNSETEKRKTMCGTPNYIAPQILQNNSHSYQVDIWSLGVIAYALLIGRPPFQTNDVKLTYSKIKSCNYSFPDTIPLQSKTKRFISKMLIRDPCRRSTIQQILQDQFFIASTIPTSLPITVLGQPPNQNFLKKFQQLKSSNQYHTSKEGFSKRQTLSTERIDRRQRQKGQSLGRMLVRANSIDKVDKKNHVVQRACSSAALMIPKKNIQPYNQGSFQTRAINANIQALGPQVWVTYSQQNPKFGICYILNSNATGMKFNDSTYIVSNSNFTKLKYYPNTKQPSKGELYDVINTPDALSKKMKIISYYQKELKNRKESQENKMNNQERIQRQKSRHRQTQQTAMNIYVIKYYKTSKVHIFWFNNQDYQVIFKDHSQLQISKEHINYVNKYGQRKYFHKNNLNDQPQDIKKRMGHTETLFKKIKQSRFDKNSQNNSNKQNQPTMLVRSSSVTKVDKPKYTLMKGCASVSKLASYKLIK